MDIYLNVIASSFFSFTFFKKKKKIKNKIKVFFLILSQSHLLYRLDGPFIVALLTGQVFLLFFKFFLYFCIFQSFPHIPPFFVLPPKRKIQTQMKFGATVHLERCHSVASTQSCRPEMDHQPYIIPRTSVHSTCLSNSSSSSSSSFVDLSFHFFLFPLFFFLSFFCFSHFQICAGDDGLSNV